MIVFDFRFQNLDSYSWQLKGDTEIFEIDISDLHISKKLEHRDETNISIEFYLGDRLIAETDFLFRGETLRMNTIARYSKFLFKKIKKIKKIIIFSKHFEDLMKQEELLLEEELNVSFQKILKAEI